MTSEQKIEKLGDALLATIDEFSETHRLTTGEAMGALFGVGEAAIKMIEATVAEICRVGGVKEET